MNYQDNTQKVLVQTPVLSDQDEDTQNTQNQPLQLMYILPNLYIKLWPSIKQELESLTKSQNITAFQLSQKIENIYIQHFPNTQNIKNKINFINLQKSLDNFTLKADFLKKIPELAQQALKIQNIFPDYLNMLSQNNDCVELTRQQCAILITNMFFCTMHLQPDYKMLPNHFIMANLFNRTNENQNENFIKYGKIKCIIQYLLFTLTREFKENEKITFMRKKELLKMNENQLCDFLYCEQGQMEDVQNAYIVDFANKKIGGGVLNVGCVQEEILFLTHPETLISLLITWEIQKDEAIIIKGVKRIVNYSGYRDNFTFQGLCNNSRSVNFICIDAENYSNQSHTQYGDEQRELNKAYCGFYGIDRICTGKWGCGVFGGEWQLKLLIQWVAASLSGCQQLIFINDEKFQYNQAFKLLQQQFTAKQLWEYIQLYCIQKKENQLLETNAIEYILCNLIK